MIFATIYQYGVYSRSHYRRERHLKFLKCVISRLCIKYYDQTLEKSLSIQWSNVYVFAVYAAVLMSGHHIL